MLKNSIKDPSIAIKPSAKLIDFIKSLDDATIDLPENLLNIYRAYTKDTRDRKIYNQSFEPVVYSMDEQSLLQTLENDLSTNDGFEKCLNSLSLDVEEETESSSDVETVSEHESKMSKNKAKQNRAKQRQKELSRLELNLNDLKWLHQYLSIARQQDDSVGYLHDLIDGAHLVLPRNVMIERNPVLEARCQRLKREQEEQSYRMMTKNVDCSRTHIPEDTIAYQMKQINRHLIAVLQFIFSVVAGFAFGFIGVELIIGNLDFGFRLLLGIICALTIALAEIYFLAKKLNEDIDFVEQVPSNQPVNALQKPVNNKKEHDD